MKREIIITADGSKTIFLPEWHESYHSRHGAIQEAYHVFIRNGLFLIASNKDKLNTDFISILEIGFGTGLNAIITFIEAKKQNIKIKYHGVDAHPILKEEIRELNYITELKIEKERGIFDDMHRARWNQEIVLSPSFYLTKRHQFFQDIDDENSFDLIYFDAFGFRVQPELWDSTLFKKMHKALKNKGILTTYVARTHLKKIMQEAGFQVKKVVGPPGKREMTIGYKII